MQGKFITFEGGEGAGKSTQIRLLADQLIADGKEVVLTREPGGTPGAEAIRGLLLSGAEDKWDVWSEVFLIMAARRDHMQRVIEPALKAGKIVLCDRFYDSTIVYQAHTKNIDPAKLDALNEIATDQLQPDLTILLDVPVDIGLARAKNRGEQSRFDVMSIQFHEKIRQGFLMLADKNPARIYSIDATQPLEKIFKDIWQRVQLCLM